MACQLDIAPFRIYQLDIKIPGLGFFFYKPHVIFCNWFFVQKQWILKDS